MKTPLTGIPYMKRTGLIPMPYLQADGRPYMRPAYTVSVMAEDLSREAIIAEDLDYTEALAMVRLLEYKAVRS